MCSTCSAGASMPSFGPRTSHPSTPPWQPVSAYLGALGTTGLTAYAGLLRIAALQPGDVVFVSAAAGAVGTQAGQMAALLGASRVIGSAGTAGKAALIRDAYGFDDAFSYRDAPVAGQLRKAAPDGIDVYFDNVGGDHSRRRSTC